MIHIRNLFQIFLPGFGLDDYADFKISEYENSQSLHVVSAQEEYILENYVSFVFPVFGGCVCGCFAFVNLLTDFLMYD